MKTYLIRKLSTHDLVENPSVAFHEGFADYWMMALKNIYLNEMGLSPKKPEIILKKYLNEKMNLQDHSYFKCEHSLIPLLRNRDKGRLECHEKGWLNIFQLLTLDDFTSPGSTTTEEVFTYNLYVGQNAEGQYATKLNNGIASLGSENMNCAPFPLNMSFIDLLQLVHNMDISNMNLTSFLNRISDATGTAQADIDTFYQVIDPTNDKNLTEFYCTYPYY